MLMSMALRYLDNSFNNSLIVKKIIVILLLNFCWLNGHSVGDSLPELNRRILEICDSLLGQKIGNGDCGEFVLGVLDKLSDKIAPAKYLYSLNEIVTIKKRFRKFVSQPKDYHVMAGDIILFKRHFKFVDTLTWEAFSFSSSHVAIIHHRANNYTMAIINQYKDQVVCIEDLPIGGMYRGEIIILRAVLKE